MGSLIMLAVYAALAGAVWFGIHNFLSSYEAKGAAAQLAQDRPIINACKTDLDTATKANQTLQADVTRLGEERALQNRKVDEFEQHGKAAKAQRETALATVKAGSVARDADNAALATALVAARNLKGLTCEATLAAIDDNLRTLARERVRDKPFAAAGPGDSGGGDKPPAGANPGSGPVPKP